MKPLFLVFRGGGTPPWCQRTRIFFAISARGVRFGAEQTLSQLQMRKFSPRPQKQQKEERRGEERNVGGEGAGKKKDPMGERRRGIFLGVKGGGEREEREGKKKLLSSSSSILRWLFPPPLIPRPPPPPPYSLLSGGRGRRPEERGKKKGTFPRPAYYNAKGVFFLFISLQKCQSRNSSGLCTSKEGSRKSHWLDCFPYYPLAIFQAFFRFLTRAS